MPLIEGVGDEVTDFFIVVGVLLVGWLAWCSTSIVDQPLIRTVLILQHQTRTRIAELRANHQGAFERPPNLEVSEEEASEASPVANDSAEANCPESSDTDAITAVPTETDGPSQQATSTEEVLIEAMDSLNNDNNVFAQRTTKNDAPQQNNPQENNPQENNPQDITHNTNAENNVADTSLNDTDNISIKLKFINDDQKVVTGSLKEMLGDFKRRHFRMELDARKLVRLVFKGRVLQPDSETLETCGLYNNCVVHCLIHQPHNSTNTSQPGQMQPTTDNNSASVYFTPQSFQDLQGGAGLSSAHHDWDLSRLLVSVVTLILGLAWYSRYHYAQLFTATTTLALYAFTAIFTVSLFSNFFPEQEAIRNVE